MGLLTDYNLDVSVIQRVSTSIILVLRILGLKTNIFGAEERLDLEFCKKTITSAGF